MAYAVVQHSLECPTQEQLIRAFESVPSLSALDARLIVKRGFGVLVDGLSAGDAERVASSLQRAGVPATAVDQAELPELAKAGVVRRIDCAMAALSLTDKLGRTARVPWESIKVIAAGDVTRIEARDQVTVVQTGSGENTHSQVGTERREHFVRRPTLAIVGGHPRQHFTAQAAQLQFPYLGSRRTPSRAQNFILVVRDLLGHAPRALINRGAADLGQGGDRLLRYASAQAFEREIVWLMWWGRKQIE